MQRWAYVLAHVLANELSTMTDVNPDNIKKTGVKTCKQ